MGIHIKTFNNVTDYLREKGTFTDRHVVFVRDIKYVDFGDYDNSNLNEFGLEGDLIITAESNPPVFAALSDAGIPYDTTAGGYTIADLAAITDEDIAPQEDGEATADPIFYYKPIVNFNEFKYFTGIDGSCFYDAPNDDYGLFEGTNLKRITIPKNVNCSEYKINGAFNGCSLDYISVDEENQTYDSRGNCNAIIKTSTNQLIKASNNTVIPNTVTELYSISFSGLTINSITIPSSVISIGNNAFSGCTSLQSITIPSSVTSIGFGAFTRCTSLQNITIPSSVTSIGTSAFANCTSLQSITIPNSVINLGTSNLFGYCSSLQSVSIPSSVTSIGNNMFINCVSLQSITIPSSVTSIGSQAFYGCASLQSITIPSSVTTIGTYAFCNCSSLNSITCNAATPPTVSNNTFKDVGSKGVLTVPTSSERAYLNGWIKGFTNYYLGKYGWIINDIVLAAYTNGELYNILNKNDIPRSCSFGYRISDLGNITNDQILNIEENDESLSSDDFVYSIFANANNLETFEEFQYFTGVSSDITRRTKNQGRTYGFFNGCTSLRKVVLPAHLSAIGSSCFENTALEEITIPQSVTEINPNAFYKCNITKIEIPSSVTNIYDRGLCCPNLTEIICKGNSAPNIRQIGISGVKTIAFGAEYNISDTHIPRQGILKYPAGADYSEWMSTNNFYLGYFGWTSEEF